MVSRADTAVVGHAPLTDDGFHTLFAKTEVDVGHDGITVLTDDGFQTLDANPISPCAST